jgi:hypothetical protein
MIVTSFETRVTDLCSRAVTAEDDEEVRRLSGELRQILHERIEQLRRKLVVSSIVSGLFGPERSEKP